MSSSSSDTEELSPLLSELESCSFSQLEEELEARGLLSYVKNELVNKVASIKYVEEVFTIWYCNKRLETEKISDDQIKEKFAELLQEYTNSALEFEQMDRWIGFWKSRNKIRADQIFFAKFIRLPESLPLNYFNLSIQICYNLNGSIKLPLLVSDNKHLKCNVESIVKNLSIDYAHNEHGIFMFDMLVKWFRDNFVPRVKYFLDSKGLPQKAILLINSMSKESMKVINIDGIKFIYVPWKLHLFNMQIQHKSRYITDKMKSTIFAKINNSLMNKRSLGMSEDEAVDSFSVENLIYLVYESWNEMKQTDISG